ncbi:MAG: hypothetical protein ACYTG5_15515 [Planctomycetota bacterium]|jgi:hypothetical protein
MSRQVNISVCSIALTLACFQFELRAQEANQELRPWTADDVIMQERSSGWQLSRDGSLALWLRQKPDKEKDGSVTTLML